MRVRVEVFAAVLALENADVVVEVGDAVVEVAVDHVVEEDPVVVRKVTRNGFQSRSLAGLLRT
jgi:hypothetical protein